jgi:hypothetical protein
MQENIVESKDHYEKGFLVLSFMAPVNPGEGKARKGKRRRALET